MKVTAILPALALLPGMLSAQTPAAKPGSVEGIVMNSAMGDPLKKAVVTLHSIGLGPAPAKPFNTTTMTDAAGHFQFDKVEPGSYDISAHHDGFMTPQSRQAAFTAIVVGEEQQVKDVAIKLLPLATVSGHVLDEDGDPIARAQIAVLRYFYSQRGKHLTGVTGIQSNDLGEFEATMPPGRYYFQATAWPPRNIPPRTRWTRSEEAYPVVFYPNASEADQATVINVAAGAHLNNIDFRMRKMPAYHIRGKVSDKAAGQRIGGVEVERSGLMFGTNVAGSPIESDGSFDVRGLVSDSYQVMYSQFASGRTFNAYEKVRVKDADVDGVALAPKPAMTVSGAVTAEGSQPQKLDVQVSLVPVNAMDQGGDSVASADGSFVIADVPPEAFDLQISNVPPGEYVKSIRLGDREADNGEIDLTGHSNASLNIVLGADGSEVDGTVLNASGQPAAAIEVTLAPAEKYDSRWDLLKRTVTDPAGNFQIKDVAPGEYKVFALEGDPDHNTGSAEFRKPFESRSASVTVGPKDRASVQLSVITDEDVEREIYKLP